MYKAFTFAAVSFVSLVCFACSGSRDNDLDRGDDDAKLVDGDNKEAKNGTIPGLSPGGSSSGGSSGGGLTSSSSGAPIPPPTGTSSSSSGGANQCTGKIGTDACSVCLEQACCAQVAACVGNQDCVAFLNCGKACTDEACVQQCIQQHQTGANLYVTFLNCQKSSCGTKCGS